VIGSSILDYSTISNFSATFEPRLCDVGELSSLPREHLSAFSLAGVEITARHMIISSLALPSKINGIDF
jgi:hypothetical protein